MSAIEFNVKAIPEQSGAEALQNLSRLENRIISHVQSDDFDPDKFNSDLTHIRNIPADSIEGVLVKLRLWKAINVATDDDANFLEDIHKIILSAINDLEKLVDL